MSIRGFDYETHPEFMGAGLGNERVRFVLKPHGVFHQNVFLFEKIGGVGGNCGSRP